LNDLAGVNPNVVPREVDATEVETLIDYVFSRHSGLVDMTGKNLAIAPSDFDLQIFHSFYLGLQPKPQRWPDYSTDQAALCWRSAWLWG